jgi:hypothetical protein
VPAADQQNHRFKESSCLRSAGLQGAAARAPDRARGGQRVRLSQRQEPGRACATLAAKRSRVSAWLRRGWVRVGSPRARLRDAGRKAQPRERLAQAGVG